LMTIAMIVSPYKVLGIPLTGFYVLEGVSDQR